MTTRRPDRSKRRRTRDNITLRPAARLFSDDVDVTILLILSYDNNIFYYTHILLLSRLCDVVRTEDALVIIAAIMFKARGLKNNNKRKRTHRTKATRERK